MRGTHCPSPPFEAIHLTRECTMGDTFAITAGDTRAGSNIPAWVSRAGHTLVDVGILAGGGRYLTTRSR